MARKLSSLLCRRVEAPTTNYRSTVKNYGTKWSYKKSMFLFVRLCRFQNVQLHITDTVLLFIRQQYMPLCNTQHYKHKKKTPSLYSIQTAPSYTAA